MPSVSAEPFEDLEFEHAQLRKLIQAMHNDSEALRCQSGAETALTATFLHSYYNGIEKCLVYIRQLQGKPRLSGDNWHQHLLVAFKEAEGFPFEAVKELLGFRHVFRHSYFFDLRPSRVADLAEVAVKKWSILDEWLNRQKDLLKA